MSKNIFVRFIKKIVTFAKNVILWSCPALYLGWAQPILSFIANALSLSKWIRVQNRKKGILNDFFQLKRDYSKRTQLYQYVIDQTLGDTVVDYIEFGVSQGYSFRWWTSHLTHPDTRLYGFDTFEGLPEHWGTFQKGDMKSQIPQIDDSRVTFVKGLFQDTVPNFLNSKQLINERRKVIHLDADLFSSTLYALTAMAPYLHPGDILLFDEFNVPNHEFLAFKMFTASYRVNTELLGAVNNYYQVAFIIRGDYVV